MKTSLRSLLAGALLLGAAAPALAQTPDSLLAVSYQGQSRFRVNVDGGALFGGVFDGDAGGTGVPIEGAGTRIVWYPRKAAFRAGCINGTQWDAANIGEYSVAMGQDVRASAANATAFGLRTTAAQVTSFAAGDGAIATGAASVALGYHAHTNARQGSFVFSDRSSVDTLRAGVNHSANWRVSGGFRIFTASNLATGVTIQSGATVSNWGHSNAVISTSTGAILTTGGVWQNASDVHRKRGFADVSGEDVLMRLRALPIQTWSYRVDANDVRHLGPTAQDFHQVFGYGDSAESIATVDADGVALAAIQGLHKLLGDKDAQIAAMRDEQSRQADRIEALERQLRQLLKQNQPGQR